MKFQTLVLAIVSGGVAGIVVGGLAAKSAVDVVKAEGITLNNVPGIGSLRLAGGGNAVSLTPNAQAAVDRLPMMMAGAAAVAALAVVLGAGVSDG